MQKIVSVASIAAVTLLLSSCTFGKTEITQTPVDTKAPVVEVDTTTSGALANPDFVKEIDDVVNKSLEKAMNSSGSETPSQETPSEAAPSMVVPSPEVTTEQSTNTSVSTDSQATQTGAATESMESPKAGE